MPVVRWGDDRTLPGESVLERDEELLDRLPAADRELFGCVMAHLDKPGWELFERYVLPGWRAHDKALLDHYPRMAATVLDAAGHNPQVERAETVRALVGHWLDGITRPC
ncbi:hypothetical protein ACWEOI_14910 [Nocardia sp. NPDC004340]